VMWPAIRYDNGIAINTREIFKPKEFGIHLLLKKCLKFIYDKIRILNGENITVIDNLQPVLKKSK
jgi:hypothetical protein